MGAVTFYRIAIKKIIAHQTWNLINSQKMLSNIVHPEIAFEIGLTKIRFWGSEKYLSN